MFRYKKVKKYHVTGFFFQLLATDILNFEVIRRNSLRCFVTETPAGKYKYLDPLSWKGILFHPKARGGAPVDVDQPVQHSKDAQT